MLTVPSTELRHLPSSRLDQLQYRLIALSILSAIPLIVVFTIFWGIIGNMIPPYDGNFPAADLHRLFVESAGRYRIGFAVAMAGGGFFMTWAVGIFCVMRRVEGGRYGILSYTQLIGGALTYLAVALSNWCFLSAAYRPEQMPPETIRLLYDMGWLVLDVGFLVTTFQYIAIGVLFLNDPREKPLLPKWLCWLGFWCGAEFIVEIVMPSFRSGPFSWSGLFSYWLAFFVPFTYMVLLTGYLTLAVRRLRIEDDAV